MENERPRMIDDFIAVEIMCNHAQVSIMKAARTHFDTVRNGEMVKWCTVHANVDFFSFFCCVRALTVYLLMHFKHIKLLRTQKKKQRTNRKPMAKTSSAFRFL